MGTLETIERLAEIVDSHDLAEIEVSDGQTRVKISRSATRAVVASHPDEDLPASDEIYDDDDEANDDDEEGTAATVVTAQLVGLFHHVSPALRHGTPVREGDVIGSIHSMKLMNDVKSPVNGVIAEVMIEENAPVGYGQPLFRIDLA